MFIRAGSLTLENSTITDINSSGAASIGEINLTAIRTSPLELLISMLGVLREDRQLTYQSRRHRGIYLI